MAQNALVGVAESGLYPSFSLNGSIGLASGSPGTSSFGDLFQADSLTYSIGPSFVWPFLNYGRIKNEIRVQDARLQQALVRYRKTALLAAEAQYAGAQQAMAASRTAIDGARAQVGSAEANLERSRKDADRMRNIKKQDEGAISQKRLEMAEASLAAAEGGHEAVRSAFRSVVIVFPVMLLFLFLSTSSA